MTPVVVTLWLLIMPADNGRPAVVVERFATSADCEVLRKPLADASRARSLICIKAQVAR